MAWNKSPKTIGEAVQRLKLFNETLQTLRERKFISQASSPNIRITWRFSPDGATYEKQGPDEEARLAFVSTLRMFIQPQDGISIEKMAELYASLPVGNEVKQGARRSAESLKEFFAKPTGIVFQEDALTYGRLFDVFMYGHLVHANDDKRPDYERWMKHQMAAPMMPVFFDQIVGFLLRGISSFKTMNEQTIQQLEALPQGQSI